MADKSTQPTLRLLPGAGAPSSSKSICARRYLACATLTLRRVVEGIETDPHAATSRLPEYVADVREVLAQVERKVELLSQVERAPEPTATRSQLRLV